LLPPFPALDVPALDVPALDVPALDVPAPPDEGSSLPLQAISSNAAATHMG
jgi:hypothetical protein